MKNKDLLEWLEKNKADLTISAVFLIVNADGEIEWNAQTDKRIFFILMIVKFIFLLYNVSI